MMMPVHPGRMLKRELEARGMAANRLAIALRLPSGRVTQILNEKRGITPGTALRLGRFFGNSASFRVNLEAAFEEAKGEPALRLINESEVAQPHARKR